jgi:hypothetical protein
MAEAPTFSDLIAASWHQGCQQNRDLDGIAMKFGVLAI